MKKKFGIYSDGGDIIKKNRKRSILQEDRLADDMGAKKTPNSGATPGEKGDLKLGDFRIECKNCQTQSFIVKLKEFLKIEKEAEDAGKKPALIFSFDKLRMIEDLVVIRKKDFEKLFKDFL